MAGSQFVCKIRIFLPDSQHDIFMFLRGFFRPTPAFQRRLPYSLDILVQVLQFMLQQLALTAFKQDFMKTAVQPYQLIKVTFFS